MYFKLIYFLELENFNNKNMFQYNFEYLFNNVPRNKEIRVLIVGKDKIIDIENSPVIGWYDVTIGYSIDTKTSCLPLISWKFSDTLPQPNRKYSLML